MKSALLVAIGAVIGSTARYAVAVAMPVESGQFPWATLLVNLVGACSLGMLVGAVARRRGLREGVAPLLVGQGLLGSFTTFSAFAVEVDLLVSDGRPALAALYLAVTLAAGVLSARVGLSVGGRAK